MERSIEAYVLFGATVIALLSCRPFAHGFSVVGIPQHVLTQQAQPTRSSCIFMSERVETEGGLANSVPDRNSNSYNGTENITATARTQESSLLPPGQPQQQSLDATSTTPATTSVGDAIRQLGPDLPTVWTAFSQLATEYPVTANLGQGFPDWPPPRFATEALVGAVVEHQNHHQYTRPAGHPPLVQQLARRYSMHLHTCLREPLDPLRNVAVTVGASQALYLALQCVVQQGDEVILLEPFFDLYENQIHLAGGIPVYVPLEYNRGDGQQSGWVLNEEALRSRITPKTKAILLNSPHNPTGKIFTRAEMEMIANSMVELAHPDCIVISDEVYKYIVHAPPPPEDDEGDIVSTVPGHVHFASLPGMWNRTLTISSAGKTFSATGWQIGWCIGPSYLVQDRMHRLLPYVQFCASTVVQEALGRALVAADEPYHGYPSYYSYLVDNYRRKRDLLAAALQPVGLTVPDWTTTPGGGFFILARVEDELWERVRKSSKEESTPTEQKRPDWLVCEYLLKEYGLVCIPSSPFFSKASVEQGRSDAFIRIAFCKRDVTLDAARGALAELRDDIRNEKLGGTTIEETVATADISSS